MPPLHTCQVTIIVFDMHARRMIHNTAAFNSYIQLFSPTVVGAASAPPALPRARLLQRLAESFSSYSTLMTRQEADRCRDPDCKLGGDVRRRYQSPGTGVTDALHLQSQHATRHLMHSLHGTSQSEVSAAR